MLGPGVPTVSGGSGKARLRTIIAGSRYGGFSERDVGKAVAEAFETHGFWPSVVLSGTARGPDRLGEFWATRHGIPVERYPPDPEHGFPAALFIRNNEMLDRAEALIALWDGHSNGTGHVIDGARDRQLLWYVYRKEG